MAGKWGLFFHRVFTFLSSHKSRRKSQLSILRRLRRSIYIVIGGITILCCLLVAPSLARISIANITHTNSVTNLDETAIAQTPPESNLAGASAEQADQIARESYAARQFNAAAIAFDQAAQRYAAQGDFLRQALSLSNLSLTHQQLGFWNEAEQAISASLGLLNTELQQQDSPDHQSAYAQALDIRAKFELSRGQAEQAIDTWEQAVKIHQQLGELDRAVESQINQARALQYLGLYKRSIVVLQNALKTPEQPTLLLAGLQDESSVLPDEEMAQELNRRLQLLPASVTTTMALQSLGKSLQVVGDLEQAQTILQYSLDMATSLASINADLTLTDAIASAHLSLGNIVSAQAIAELRLNSMSVKQAVDQLEQTSSLSPVQKEFQHQWIKAAERFNEQTQKALDFYQQAADSSSPDLIQVQALLNGLSLFLDKHQALDAETAIAQIDPLLDRLPVSRTAIDARINFAQTLSRMAQRPAENFFTADSSSNAAAQQLQAAQLLATAHQQAIALGDAQAESYALGSLGTLYERNQQWAEAATLTQQALEKVSAASVTNLPRTINDADLAYRWQHQLGRIRAVQGDRAEAIKAYEAAVKTLQDRLRKDVATSNLNYQFSFDEDAQKPVHQDFIELLLRPETEQSSQKDLQRVREVSSLLLEAQLTSFLQEPCAIVTPQQVDTIVKDKAPNTALFYPVILPDRLDVVVKMAGKDQLLHYSTLIPQNKLLETLKNLQVALEEDYTFEAVQTLSKQLYGLLIQPAEAELQANQVDTLIFTLDRRLQPIPMAALYDGTEYLIDRYAISEVLGLRFADTVKPLQPEELKVIGAGLSTIPASLSQEIRQKFSPLSNVEDEMVVLKDSGIDATILMNENFTLTNFNAKLNEQKFPVVHLATHGQFSLDPQKTFLLTSQDSSSQDSSKSGLINVNELGALFRVRGQIRPDSIELLVLNACETASGDDLATLGLAGTAVRAGARSAIASLWTLDDAPSATFTQQLYHNLQQPDVSKAEALRQVQLALKQDPQYKHPRYWSPYILAGNWLQLTSAAKPSA